MNVPVTDASVGNPAAVLTPLETGGWSTSDTLAWAAILVFVLGAAVSWVGASRASRGEAEPRFDLAARNVSAVAWALFGLFWLSMAPYFYYEAHSPIESILSVAAVPLCLYTGYLLHRGRSSLLLLSKAVAIMGVIYLPAETIPLVRQWLIETTAAQTHTGMELLGYSPGLTEGPEGYLSKFDFVREETVTGRLTYMVLACTGLGSMAIFGGLIAATRAPLRRKLVAIGLAVGIIWILNLVRNVFVGLASPWGWFQFEPLITIAMTFGAVESQASFWIAHTAISQTLAVVVLIGITLLVLRIVPEMLAILEEVLFVVTGSEWDLGEALGLDPTPARTDGSGAVRDGTRVDDDDLTEDVRIEERDE